MRKLRSRINLMIFFVILVGLNFTPAAFALDSSSSPLDKSSQTRGDSKSPGLSSVDDTPLGERVPLILVHGNNNESLDQFGWDDFIRLAGEDQNFTARYKLYLYGWNSKTPNRENGILLGQAIDNANELDNREIVLLAYSRGGIVSRYFMNTYVTRKGNFTGRLGGERVKYLVTLATPHKGTPGADPTWILFSLDCNYDGLKLAGLSKIYDRFYDTDTDIFLFWHDEDNELTKDTVCWEHNAITDKDLCKAPYSKYSDLIGLNKQEQYFDKIIAFGGNVYTGEPISNEDFDEILDFGEWTTHEGLGIFSILMAQTPVIPPGYPDTPIDSDYRPFEANDGLVPLISALFLKPGAGNLFNVDSDGNLTYNETQLRSLCRIAQCNVITGRRADHSDFINDDSLIRFIIGNLTQLD